MGQRSLVTNAGSVQDEIKQNLQTLESVNSDPGNPVTR